MTKLILLSIFILSMTACSQVRHAPAPVESPQVITQGKKSDGVGGDTVSIGRSYRQPSPNTRVKTAKGVQVQAYTQNNNIALKATHGSAVQALLSQAKMHENQGNLEAAVNSLERALGIERKNAHLWHKMASLRIQQHNYPVAIEMAKKSNVMAGGNPKLKQKNWKLIAKARRFMGNESGAMDAEHNAMTIY